VSGLALREAGRAKLTEAVWKRAARFCLAAQREIFCKIQVCAPSEASKFEPEFMPSEFSRSLDSRPTHIRAVALQLQKSKDNAPRRSTCHIKRNAFFTLTRTKESCDTPAFDKTRSREGSRGGADSALTSEQFWMFVVTNSRRIVWLDTRRLWSHSASA